MIKRGTFDPSEGYNYAKAREDFIMNKSRKDTGLLGTATEALGGAVSAGGLAKAGVTAARFVPEGLSGAKAFLAGSAAAGADAAAIGGFSGAMEGNGLQERATNAGIGTAVGGAIGGATPGVMTALKILATPITSQIAARLIQSNMRKRKLPEPYPRGKPPRRKSSLRCCTLKTRGRASFTLADASATPASVCFRRLPDRPGRAARRLLMLSTHGRATRAGGFPVPYRRHLMRH
jgi:hypothetical protein